MGGCGLIQVWVGMFDGCGSDVGGYSGMGVVQMWVGIVGWVWFRCGWV